MSYNLVEQSWVSNSNIDEEVLLTTATPFDTLAEAQTYLNGVKSTLSNNNLFYVAKIFSAGELVQAFRYILLEDFNVS